ncbi:MAG: amidohydrolase family protein [Verrucomicrobia bacterium]|nr:amidohydrolase family protein [Verrucomicrobiota bacterium]
MPAEAQTIRGIDPATSRPVAVEVSGSLVRSVREESHDVKSWVVPGLVDLQVNGYMGRDVNAASPSAVEISRLCQEMLKVGVTTFLPTVITHAEGTILASLKAVSQAVQSDPVAAQMIVGIHVEGPHIAPEDGPRGAHPAAHVRAPSREEFDRWQEAAADLITLVTLSPHWAEAPDYVRHLVAKGVNVSIGHTSADEARIAAVVAAGARLSTHLGNGCSAMLDRRRNVLWPQLAEDALTAMFIADGHHLVPSALKTMLRAKGLSRSLVVSDTVALGGMPAGRYATSVGGKVIVREDGYLALDDGTGNYLAGAALPLIASIPVLVHQASLGLSEALSLSTVNPGRWVKGRGTLKPGSRADLVLFDWDGSRAIPSVKEVWLGGVRMV